MKEKIKQLQDLDFKIRRQEAFLKQLKKDQINLRHDVQKEFMKLQEVLITLDVVTPHEID